MVHCSLLNCTSFPVAPNLRWSLNPWLKGNIKESLSAQCRAASVKRKEMCEGWCHSGEWGASLHVRAAGLRSYYVLQKKYSMNYFFKPVSSPFSLSPFQESFNTVTEHLSNFKTTDVLQRPTMKPFSQRTKYVQARLNGKRDWRSGKTSKERKVLPAALPGRSGQVRWKEKSTSWWGSRSFCFSHMCLSCSHPAPATCHSLYLEARLPGLDSVPLHPRLCSDVP